MTDGAVRVAANFPLLGLEAATGMHQPCNKQSARAARFRDCLGDVRMKKRDEAANKQRESTAALEHR